MTLYEQVKDYLLCEIDGYTDLKVYIDEIGYTFTQYLIVDGTVEYNRLATIKKITENWEEYGAIFEYMKDNWGEAMNPFDNPEAFDAQAYEIIANHILSDLQLEGENEDDEIILTEEVIEQIKQYIESDTDDYFEY